MLQYNDYLKDHSRRFRKNMTEAEKLLWYQLRNKKLKNLQFYRQKPIGNFIVDFYCPKVKLVIELDGGQHYTECGINKDKRRDNYIIEEGMKVLRFSDRDVFDKLDAVMEKIWSCL